MDVEEIAGRLEPTHYCVICAARWINHADGTWSLATKKCGPCCDNVPMDTAPIVKFEPDGTLSGRGFERVRDAYRRRQWLTQVERYRGILCARCDEPFEQHGSNWACPHRVPPRFKFPAHLTQGTQP